MGKIRKPFQGTWNIIRFNWHFYTLSIAAIVVLFLLSKSTNATVSTASFILLFFVIALTLVSLAVSSYVYDFSNLYTLDWLDKIHFSDKEKIVNIHAGFDETSELIQNKFPYAELLVFDFYDPVKHPEVSIKRARMAYPPYPNTQPISTNHLPLMDDSTDRIFNILSAHEIRNDMERVNFFKELKRVLNSSGQIIVTEHLRDVFNFFAYNIGFFHFHSRATWLRTFQQSELQVVKEIKITPFITTFILKNNGTTS
ncbi:MAG: methyltransferase domain-containing protein [Ginsengibacter sp.]